MMLGIGNAFDAGLMFQRGEENDKQQAVAHFGGLYVVACGRDSDSCAKSGMTAKAQHAPQLAPGSRWRNHWAAPL